MEPMDMDEVQQITDRLMQSIWDSRRLRRSGSLGNVPSPLSGVVHFPHPQVQTLPILGVPTQNLSVTTCGGAAVTPTLTNTVTLMLGKGTRLMPSGSNRRSTEGSSILNIPPYTSHNVRDDANLSLH